MHNYQRWFVALIALSFALLGCRIEGKVTHNGVGLEGISVMLSGDASMTTTTDSDGDYFFEVPDKKAHYIVTPEDVDYSFTPPYREVNINNDTPESGVTGVDFAATFVDHIPPEVISSIPENGQTDVPLDTLIQVSFSEDLSLDSISSSTVILQINSQQISGDLSYSDKVIRFYPDEALLHSSTYSFIIKKDVCDLAGNQLSSDIVIQFQTVMGYWTPVEQKLTVDDSPYFGSDVSVDGDQILVGASGFNAYPGSAYIFERSETGQWTEAYKLVPNNSYVDDGFGSSVSIHGDLAVISRHGSYAYGHTSAVVFEKTGGAWSQAAVLLPSIIQDGDLYGAALAATPDLIVVGAEHYNGEYTYSGTAYVYEKVNENWVQTAVLKASTPQLYHNFGCDISISEGTIAIGAFGSDTPSVYIFDKIDGVWTETANLMASDTSANQLGISVSISGNVVIAGARTDSDIASLSGAAYIFQKNGNQWNEVVKLHPSDGVENGRYGEFVSISGDKAVVGSLSGELHDGAIYVVTKTDDSWVESDVITLEDVTSSPTFGEKVSISGDTFACTDRYRNDVYVYDYQFVIPEN